jgi:hypothetical protein
MSYQICLKNRVLNGAVSKSGTARTKMPITVAFIQCGTLDMLINAEQVKDAENRSIKT